MMMSFSSLRHPFLTTMQAALAACCLFISPSAQAQQDDTFNRLNRLERELDTLSRAVYRGDKSAAPSLTAGSANTDSGYQANLEVRLADLEKQIRELTGKVEQQSFDLQQLKEQLNRSQADMELRVADLEKKTGGTPNSMPGDTSLPSDGKLSSQTGTLTAADSSRLPPPDVPPPNLAAPPAADPNAPASANSPTQQQLGTLTEAPGGALIPSNGVNDPAGLYENAFSQLKSGNHAVAQRDFNSFLTSYPQHPLAPNATYWLGETYYAQGKYDQASRIFAESYKKYPKGPKAADSLLKLGMSLGGSGKSKEACVSFKQLKKEFSSGQSTAVRRADQEMSRLGCDA